MHRRFHVTSSRNRESILRHGLDCTRMSSSRGIAGSSRPEVDGIFLCSSAIEVDWFIRMNNTGGPVDVWAVDGVDGEDLLESSNGYWYLPTPISPDRLSLIEGEFPPHPYEDCGHPSSAYSSSIVVELEDGTLLRDEEAHAWMRRNVPSDKAADDPPSSN